MKLNFYKQSLSLIVLIVRIFFWISFPFGIKMYTYLHLFLWFFSATRYIDCVSLFQLYSKGLMTTTVSVQISIINLCEYNINFPCHWCIFLAVYIPYNFLMKYNALPQRFVHPNCTRDFLGWQIMAQCWILPSILYSSRWVRFNTVRLINFELCIWIRNGRFVVPDIHDHLV